MGLFGPSKKELQQEIDRLKKLLLPEQQNIEILNQQIQSLESQRKKIEADYYDESAKLNKLKSEIDKINTSIKEKKKQIFDLDFDIEMQEYGIYKPTYKFANSDKFKEELKKIRDEQKKMIKDGLACTGNMNWTVNGNASKGKKMVKDMQKLLLRAFNLECDNVIDNVKISNYNKSQEKIYKSADQISKLGEIQSISITFDYQMKKQIELAIALDFEEAKKEEKERIKEARERQREEAKIQKEIEEARNKLQKEQSHYKNALLALEEQLLKDPDNVDLLAKKRELELNIADTVKAIADVDYRQANKRAGYVYVISNIGAFGENIYKIGMTRRLDPMDRVNELGDASVPFNFDVHALIFTDDAPGLESALHNAFEDRKVNKINHRREFFHVTLDEIKKVVRDNFDKTVEWIDVPEADQYRQSLLMK
ncbi:MAG: DUF4041 domain-containing protein [Ruminococcus sp.]|nr:DUF4041 domain-containing protein [Ruminococcus sp.]